jgi:hypothetical protein
LESLDFRCRWEISLLRQLPWIPQALRSSFFEIYD